MPTHATAPLWESANTSQKLEKLRQQLDDLYRYTLGDAVNRLIAQLESHVPEDEDETLSKAKIILACRTHANILSQNCEAGHITGSALVVDLTHRQVLLNFHGKLNKWLQFGGHAEYETETWKVALREAYEESGLTDLKFLPYFDHSAEHNPFAHPKILDVDAHEIPARNNLPTHMHYDIRYLLITQHPEQAYATDESHEIRWVKFSEIHTLPLENSVLRMIRKAQKFLPSD
jgi:8-oxo-dGTP pyrophosphatase MutT (NUDIX family)